MDGKVEGAGCPVRLHSCDNYSKLCCHSDHLKGGLCKFLALWSWFTVFHKNQKHLVLVVKVILMTFWTAVVGSNPPLWAWVAPLLEATRSNSKASSCTQELVWCTGWVPLLSLTFGFAIITLPNFKFFHV